MPTPEPLTRAAALAPRTADDQTRTVRLVWSTGAAVIRQDMTGHYREVLSLDTGAVDLSALIGAPVLNAHRRGELRDVLGTVREAGIAGAEAWAIVEFSRRPDVEPIWQDVVAGVIRNVSAGYDVQDWQDSTDPATGERIRTAVRWTPRELSLVPIGADAGATTRSQENSMTGTTAAAPAIDRAAIDTEIRAIADTAVTAGLDRTAANDLASGLITRGATADDARAAAFTALAQRSAATPALRTQVIVGPSNDDPAVRAGWMADALITRVDPSYTPPDHARQYVGFTLPDMGREILRLRGVSTTGLMPASIITRALHTSSDFSIILGNTVGRTMRQAYTAVPSGLKRLGRQTTAKDFRAKYRIQLDGPTTLEAVGEHGEFKSGTLAEAAESYKLGTFGRIIGITRQALINDDIGAFSDLSRRMGQAASQFEAKFLVDLLESGAGNGPTMSDGNPLFHASHANKAGSGAVIGETTLSAGRLALRKQKGQAGDLIAVTPKHLLIPSDLETAAEKQLAAIQATSAGDVNVFAGKLDLVVEPRLTSATRWYVTADAGEVDGLEYAYLEGEPGPQIESKNGFEIDGVQIKVRLDFGAGFVDWRGWYMNAGA